MSNGPGINIVGDAMTEGLASASSAVNAAYYAARHAQIERDETAVAGGETSSSPAGVAPAGGGVEEEDQWVDEEAGAFDADFQVRVIGVVNTRTLQEASTIYDAARRGDLHLLKRMVEVQGEPVNERDRYDGTPLYYASLCGHADCVRFLLDKGANADPADFDGERSHYAALNDAIRSLLREYQAVNRQRGPLFATLYRIANTTAAHADVCLCVARDSTAVFAHKFLLAAQSPLLRQRFGPGGRWERKFYVHLVDARLSGPALRAVVGYLYTERLVYARTLHAEVTRVAQALQLTALYRYLAAHPPPAVVAGEDSSHTVAVSLAEAAYAVGSLPRSVAWAEQLSGGGAGAAAGAGAGIGSKRLKLEPVWHLRDYMWHNVLFAGMIPPELLEGEDCGDVSVPDAAPVQTGSEPSRELAGGTTVEAATGTTAAEELVAADGGHLAGNGLPYDLAVVAQEGLRFRCHRAIVCSRSPYFASLLQFRGEVQREGAESAGAVGAGPTTGARGIGAAGHADVAVVEVASISPLTLAAVLQFLYTDSAPTLPSPEHVMEALYAADLLLVGALKPVLVAQALEHVSGATVVDFLRLADLCNLHRVTAACADYAAGHLSEVLASPAFVELVRESAGSIKGRQAFDSVPVLDEVLAAISRRYGGQGSAGGSGAGAQPWASGFGAAASAGAGGPKRSAGFEMAMVLQEQQRARQGRPLKDRAEAVDGGALLGASVGAGAGAPLRSQGRAAAAHAASAVADREEQQATAISEVVAFARSLGYHIRSAGGLLIGPEAGVATR
jgi:hypothetical protein